MTWHPDIPEEYRNQIVTGDARELTKCIPDESIDLIFTDPIYDEIEDYEWLAKEAGRILKDNRACLVWIAPTRIYDVIHTMRNYLDFVMPFSYIQQASCNMIFSRRVFMWAKSCLWFEKGKSEVIDATRDGVISSGGSTGKHKWNKNLIAYSVWLEDFTNTDYLVFDPFTGSGTLPVVCKMLGRNYIAFEIDPETAELARERVLNTQPPLFVLEPEQQELILE